MTSASNMIFEMAVRLFEDCCPRQVLDEAERQPGLAAGLWAAFAASGLPDMLHGADDDPTASDMVAVARAAGQAGAPIPVVETIVGRRLLSNAGIIPPAGALALSIDGLTGSWQINHVDETTRLTGHDRAMGWATAVDHVVILSNREVLLVDTGSLALQPARDIAGVPRASCVAVDVPVTHHAACDDPDAAALFALGVAGLSIGACDRVLQLAIDYVTVRVQFGKPLASRQAIQQQVAEMASSIAASTTIVFAAARALGRPHSHLLVAAARARLADTIDRATAISHQVQGALGFSREHMLHHFTRRLWALRDAAGTASFWRLQLGQAFAGVRADELWPQLSHIGAPAAELEPY